ncbi:MAG: hypothetical protein OXE59_06345 [Bacteroidetes bacterium]|nr:hypothetical protein [Bacteroidota bacterium]MCY4233344.1 hypothetical protein [Bacteroidota bacterium]
MDRSVYRLTPRMEQNLRQSLSQYHHLFDGGRCSGWELEELFVKAIKSDTDANHLPKWREAGHDDMEDILIIENGNEYHIQIKSGKFSGKRDPKLQLSGHRLGRYNGDLNEITDYLNNRKANYITVPYRKLEDDYGRYHIYRLCYIDHYILAEIESQNWCKHGRQFRNQNKHGVLFKLVPSMSWQIWWDIPMRCLDMKEEFTDGRVLNNAQN